MPCLPRRRCCFLVTVEAVVVPAMDELRRAANPPGYLCDRDSSVQPSRNAGVSQVVDEFARRTSEEPEQLPF